MATSLSKSSCSSSDIDMQKHRIMVIGSNVSTVQRVSSYCLKKNAEVFPYYGVPTDEEVQLFDPNVLVLCQPIPESFQNQIAHPYILWSEQAEAELLRVNTPTELYAKLQTILAA